MNEYGNLIQDSLHTHTHTPPPPHTHTHTGLFGARFIQIVVNSIGALCFKVVKLFMSDLVYATICFVHSSN